MEVAKRALNMLLADLADRGTLRVGVRLFGHRVGWSTAEANKLLRQTAYADEIPADLRPFADVENVLPLGRFDSIAAGKVLDKLQTVRAWGESPIYLAIQQAIADFGTLDNSARSIVVITDGKNYQFNPPRESQPQLADVLSAAQRAKIAIHMVGFDMPDDEALRRGPRVHANCFAHRRLLCTRIRCHRIARFAAATAATRRVSHCGCRRKRDRRGRTRSIRNSR